jgi:multicomponent Na+:H+ antiporter subunit G
LKIVTMVLMVAGSLVVFLGAVGLYRMPDVYHRMQASAKASSLGVALLLLAVAFHFGDAQVTLRAVAGILFIFITVPVAAHLLARAAHRIRVPAWSGTLADELVEFQDERRRTREMEISVGMREAMEDRESVEPPDSPDESD